MSAPLLRWASDEAEERKGDFCFCGEVPEEGSAHCWRCRTCQEDMFELEAEYDWGRG